ncbi:MAG: hypothetical protein ACLP9L_34790 [Thermoguttaceae bacterium]
MTTVGIVHEVSYAVDQPITARLLPCLYGRLAGYTMLLDAPWFPKGLLPGVIGAGREESLHVACGEFRSQVPSQRLYCVEKIGLAEEVVRQILFRR